MTVHAARRCLESIAFVLVAWARTSSDAMTSVTLMEAASAQLRQLSPPSSVDSANTISQVSADYIDEMIETARLWQIYYRVYRPVSSIRLDQTSDGVASDANATARRQRGTNAETSANSIQASGSSGVTAMDFLASAAEAAQESRSAQNCPPTFPTNVTDSALPSALDTNALMLPWDAHDFGVQHATAQASLTPPVSSHAGMVDASIYNAQVLFDLEAFLKDVDQLV